MMNTLAIFGLGTPEIIAILVIVFLLFGAKKLPDLARGLGKSLGEFKKAKSEFEEELLKTEKETVSDASASKPESRPSPELSQPIDVEAETPAETKPEDK
ncbi:twin-arginine translocase TatA/TatE family subunit [Akkermansia sp. BCRC 18949]|uniref:twin-arginine translocase TatA/TatE family subunit n=1 Tax=Akkermansia sp. BCRC 18949 TaxID=3037987 RepID=UPI00384F39A8